MNKVANIIIFAVPIIFAIVFHEVAHGYVANYFGDSTAKRSGRLRLNPLVHVDPVGTVIVPLILYLTGSRIMLGWAKPVPVNFNNLRKPKQHMVWVALAGPATNFVLAFIALAIIKGMYTFQPSLFLSNTLPATPTTFILKPLAQMLPIFMFSNITLGTFNLIPIPPLDGGRILTGLLPNELANSFAKIEPFGFMIIILLVMSNVIDRVMLLIINSIINFMHYISNIPL